MDVNKLIAQREEMFDRLDRVAERLGMEPDALDGLDMFSVDMLDDLIAAIRNVRDATSALDFAEANR